MQRHTCGHDTRMTSQVHKNSYDQQPKKETMFVQNSYQLTFCCLRIQYHYIHGLQMRAKKMCQAVHTLKNGHRKHGKEKEFHSTHFIWRKIKNCLKGPWLLMNHCRSRQRNPWLSSTIAIPNPR